MNDESTVFVVDDNTAIRKGLTLSLEQRGYQVESFASAEDYLEEADLEAPGCLILDIRMKGMSGLDLQERLAEHDCGIPVIFITGHGDIPMSVRAMRRGAVDFLEKPYELRVMLKRIDEAFEEDRRLRAELAARKDIESRYERLTGRERDVMKLVVAGAANMSNREVANRLGISHRTVETYRARLMEKMQARSLAELVSMAKSCGVYREDPDA